MSIKIGLLQYHSVVGDIEQNFKKLESYYLSLIDNNKDIDLVISSEMALSGYTPLDEFYKPNYIARLQLIITKVVELTKNQKTAIIFSDAYLDIKNGKLYNAGYVIKEGSITRIIKKQKLVDYDVFNESRYFNTGSLENNIIDINGIKLGLVICEDLWHQDVIFSLLNKNISALISVNASPYYKNKLQSRLKVAEAAVNTLNVPLIYVNTVGGIDGVVFDGQSFVLNKNKSLDCKLDFAKEESRVFTLDANGNVTFENNIKRNIIFSDKSFIDKNKNNLDVPDYLANEFYNIIQLGFKNFIKDNNIKGVIIGISGGIDSALSATIAVDTLGKEKVIGVSMPSLYTSDLSNSIIKKLVANLDIHLHEIPISNICSSYTEDVSFKSTLPNQYNLSLVQQNLQSRVRGNILMALSNSYKGYVVLCNGNKSELSTGYFTLYGDSCGAFNLIKDLFKFEVFALAKWRNSNYSNCSKLQKLSVIPEECINRAPSAELSYNQVDEKDLMSYNVLDNILVDIIENNIDYINLLNKFSKKDLDLVIKLLKNSEYKRKQAVIGIKLKNKSFGKEWQLPITNGFKQQ